MRRSRLNELHEAAVIANLCPECEHPIKSHYKGRGPCEEMVDDVVDGVEVRHLCFCLGGALSRQRMWEHLS